MHEWGGGGGVEVYFSLEKTILCIILCFMRGGGGEGDVYFSLEKFKDYLTHMR